MTAGLPGTGIGGIFYLATALGMPLREAYLRLRKRSGGDWRTVTMQFAIAGAILGGIWVTGWLLGLVLAAARPLASSGAMLPPPNVLRYATLALAFGTLAGVLAGVEVLRLCVHRGRRPALLRETPLAAGRVESGVERDWRRVALLLALATVVPPRVLAQSQGPVAAHVARADSAFATGDAAVAADEYAAVLAGDPDNSHATYRLAQLTKGNPQEALRLFQRYVALEPSDPWGYIAVADALMRAGRSSEAVGWYDEALRLAPHEPEAVAGRARAFAWAGAAAPAITPVVGGSRDSDGNTTLRLGGSAELAELRDQEGGTLRLGIEATRDHVSNGIAATGLQQLALRATWRLRPGTSVDVAAGGTRVDSISGASATILPMGRVRARWRASSRGLTVDARAQRGLLAASPQLVANRIARTELGLVVASPLVRAFRLRGIGRTAVLNGAGDVNHRTTLGGVAAVAISPVVELSAQVRETRYSHASAAGYFAPRLVQVMEAGSYMEFETSHGLQCAFDLGAGAQRVADQGAPIGPWRRALRLYSFIVMPLAPGRALQLELEGEDSPVALEAATTGAWRYVSATLSLRWALR